jgi:uncharacterized protein
MLLLLSSLSFWDKTSGTWINTATILIGTLLGLALKGSLPLRMQRIITQGLGLLVLFLGITMASNLPKVQLQPLDGIIIGLIAIVLGGVLGEWWQIEQRLHKIGDRLKRLFKGEGNFTAGFVTASLLFCIGPLAIIGSLNNGLFGNNSLLSIKAAIDGLAAIAFGSSYGIGVAFSSLMVLFYQGSLSIAASLLAQAVPDPTTAPAVLLTSGVGGLMIIGLGLNLIEITQISVASFLPALIVAPLLCTILQFSSQ